MKKLLITFLIFPFLALGQTKPRNPNAPSGSWATSLLRAYAFSRLDSIRVDSVKDWSSIGQWGTSTATSAAWTNEGTESPGYYIAGTAARVLSSGNLSTSGITNQFSIVMRLKLGGNGTVRSPISLHNRLSTPSIIFELKEFGYSQAGSFCVQTSGNVCSSSGTLGGVGTKVTVIATYAGDSTRIWINGTRKDADAQTGNITVTSGYLLKIGQSDAGGFDTTYNGGYIYMCCLWGRVITQSEINSITSDPYVMFKASPGKYGQTIIISN